MTSGARSPGKRRAISEAATERFLKGGYLGTTVDDIAEAAGVAKQTVYQHFGGKEQLFTEIVMQTIDEVGQPFFKRLEELEDTDDVEASLRHLALALVAVVKEPRLLELRRLVIAEARRFPELGRLYYQRGPGRTVDALAERFEQLGERGTLRVGDVRRAAEQFNWLVLSIPINRVMLDPTVTFGDDELERYAVDAVRLFLGSYGAALPAGPATP